MTARPGDPLAGVLGDADELVGRDSVNSDIPLPSSRRGLFIGLAADHSPSRSPPQEVPVLTMRNVRLRTGRNRAEACGALHPRGSETDERFEYPPIVELLGV